MASRTPALALPVTRESPVQRYLQVRAATERLCQPLEIEDHVIQSMDDVSPPKWHLAHTTWFFEKFLLEQFEQSFAPFHVAYDGLFNSYYETLGEPFPRPRRGLLSRPTVAEVMRYRAQVDDRVLELLEVASEVGEIGGLIELGAQHEQQHQELLLMDIKHILYTNPMRPPYCEDAEDGRGAQAPAPGWSAHAGGIVEIGAGAGTGAFCFDNERPRHEMLLRPYELASRPVTNGEFVQFIEDGGYRTPAHWLSDGWSAVQRQGWEAPLYWECDGGAWHVMTLAGMHPLDPDEPACHVSLYEADAYASWAGARLPTEYEWEHGMAGDESIGAVWEWTSSAYAPYPGFEPWPGAVGEYNGKFMSSRNVLRGGSRATPRGHVRATYRNYYPPGSRWQFSGIRLAR